MPARADILKHCESLAINNGAVVCPLTVNFVGAACARCQYHHGIEQRYTIRYVMCSHYHDNHKRTLPAIQGRAPCPQYERGD